MEDVPVALRRHYVDETYFPKLLPRISQDFQTLGVDSNKFASLTDDEEEILDRLKEGDLKREFLLWDLPFHPDFFGRRGLHSLCEGHPIIP
jgi:hypothetical protein